MAGAATLTTNTANARITGVVSQSVAGDIVKAGNNLLTLTGNNTFAGNMLVNTGVLAISANNALGTSVGSTTVASGAQLRFQGALTYSRAEPLTLNGAGIGSTGALRNRSGASTFPGPITLNSNAEIQSDSGTLTLTGGINIGTFTATFDTANANGNTGPITVSTNPITGTTSGITAQGSNNSPFLTLNTANSYSGATLVGTSGRILANNSGAFGTSTVTVSNTSNAQLRIAASVNIPNSLILQGGGIAGQGILHFGATSGTAQWSGPISITG